MHWFFHDVRKRIETNLLTDSNNVRLLKLGSNCSTFRCSVRVGLLDVLHPLIEMDLGRARVRISNVDSPSSLTVLQSLEI